MNDLDKTINILKSRRMMPKPMTLTKGMKKDKLTFEEGLAVVKKIQKKLTPLLTDKEETCICGNSIEAHSKLNISHSKLPPQADKTTWEKEFDKKFGRKSLGLETKGTYPDNFFIKEMTKQGDIKSFIAELLKEKGDLAFNNGYREGQNDEKSNKITEQYYDKAQALDVYRGKLIKEVERMKTNHLDKSDQSKWGEEYKQSEEFRTSIYNQTIDRILTLIKEEK